MAQKQYLQRTSSGPFLLRAQEYAFNVLRYVAPSDMPHAFLLKIFGGANPVVRLRDGSGIALEHALFLRLLKYRKSLADRQHGIYRWDFNGVEVFASNLQFCGFYTEYLRGAFTDYYPSDFKGKTVLDIGGFAGDTARFFLEQGAKAVFIYEPVKENVAAIHLNLKKYAGRFELYEWFVCDGSGKKTIHSDYPTGSVGFGENTGGAFASDVACIPIENALTAHGKIDIAKLDCEGCEYYLIHVKDETIRKIPEWHIEFHDVLKNRARVDEILGKFKRNGFSIADTVVSTDSGPIQMYHLSKIS